MTDFHFLHLYDLFGEEGVLTGCRRDFTPGGLWDGDGMIFWAEGSEIAGGAECFSLLWN